MHTLSVQASPRSSAPLLAAPLTSLRAYLDRFTSEYDDRQLEVVKGQPVVTPSPTGPHQVCVATLTRLLHDALPTGHVVVPAPWDWVLWEHPALQLRQPDLVVVTDEQARGPRLTSPPLLAVEVVSAGSFERDVVTKRDEYARAGLSDYWLVEPDVPSVTVFTRVNDELVITRQAIGSQRLALSSPVAVVLVPTDLAS